MTAVVGPEAVVIVVVGSAAVVTAVVGSAAVVTAVVGPAAVVTVVGPVEIGPAVAEIAAIETSAGCSGVFAIGASVLAGPAAAQR